MMSEPINAPGGMRPFYQKVMQEIVSSRSLRVTLRCTLQALFERLSA